MKLYLFLTLMWQLAQTFEEWHYCQLKFFKLIKRWLNFYNIVWNNKKNHFLHCIKYRWKGQTINITNDITLGQTISELANDNKN